MSTDDQQPNASIETIIETVGPARPRHEDPALLWRLAKALDEADACPEAGPYYLHQVVEDLPSLLAIVRAALVEAESPPMLQPRNAEIVDGKVVGPRRYFQIAHSGISWTLVTTDPGAAWVLWAHHVNETGESEDVLEDEVSMRELDDEQIDRTQVHSDGDGGKHPLRAAELGAIFCSEW